MKRLILASLFVTTSVMACPDLKGTYLRCTRGSNDRIQVYIDQIKDADGVTTYSIGEDKYRANGVPEIVRIREPNTGVKIEVVTTAECRGTTSLDINVSYSFDDEVLAKQEIRGFKENGKLILSNFIQSNQEFYEEIICDDK